jgi:nucleoside-diphosphate-sugar epimerase
MSFPARVLNDIKEFYDNRPLIIEGANGALGVSALYFFSQFEIRPSSVLLTTRNSLPDLERWRKIAESVEHVRINGTNSEHDFAARLANGDFENGNVLYMAGYGQPKKFLEDPSGIISANVTRLMSYKFSVDLNSFAYISSSEIYGDTETPVNEESPLLSNPASKRGIYTESKKLGEAITLNLLGPVARRVACYRVALAFPPEQINDDSRVLADLIKSGLEIGQIVLKGSGSFLRQYQYGPHAIAKIAGSMACGSAVIYNNAGRHVVTLEDLAKIVAEIMGLPCDIVDSCESLGAPKGVRLLHDLIDDESSFLEQSTESFSELLRASIAGDYRHEIR